MRLSKQLTGVIFGGNFQALGILVLFRSYEQSKYQNANNSELLRKLGHIIHTINEQLRSWNYHKT